MIVTRFAPSPTGFLHLGHAYAALVAWQAAQEFAGKFVLRIEDIDLGRCRPEFDHAIIEDLTWLGLHWDEPVRRQSQHFGDYAGALAKLENQGLVYPCFCTRKEIEAEIARAAQAPQLADFSSTPYPGTCKRLDRDERTSRITAGLPHALRLDCSKALASIGSQPLGFAEEGAGPRGETGYQIARPELVGDIVLARKDLPASYHVAVVTDDALQGVTLVTRGCDLFAATHIQRFLQALLNLPVPKYAHHRLILDPQGRKFSKRDGAVTLRNLRLSGATPNDIRTMVGL
jgi:glutamyl-Q tRNA(Asp) synthetase